MKLKIPILNFDELFTKFFNKVGSKKNISLSEANFLRVYDFGFGWLERSAALFSALILMTNMIEEDWKIIIQSFWGP